MLFPNVLLIEDKLMPPLPNGSLKKSSLTLMASTVSQQEVQTEQNNRPETFLSPQWHGVQNINLYRESERLKTFEQWPVQFMPRHRMAEAGFYYLKRDDLVRCVFCGVEIGKWVPGDDPMVDHSKWSPECRFVKKLPVGNIPLASDHHNDDQDEDEPGFDTCGPSGIVSQSNGFPKVASMLESHHGFQKTRPPSFPQFATQDSRMKSYATWPISLKLKPHTLSDAGFFYTGKGDQIICYHCGGGLKDWEETDEPWVEHARWFSKCPYVLLVKGKEFVDDVCAHKAREDKKLNGAFSLGSSSTGDIPRATTSQIKSRNDETLATTSTPSSSSSSPPPPSSSSSTSTTIGQKSTTIGALSNHNIVSNSNIETPLINDGRLCKICFTEEMGVVFLPCGHIVACVKCASSLTTCALCRKNVTGTFRAFLS